MSRGRVLIVAGSDSGGGAGLQGDIKTVTVLGGYAATAVTAVTVQNTLGVSEVFPLPPRLVVAQMRAVLDDIGADAVKLGMLGSAGVIEAVAEVLEGLAGPVVLDPVMIAKGGAALLEPEAERALLARLVPRATVLTPNAPELAALTGEAVASAEEALAAALRLGAAVVVKGGHLPDRADGAVVDRLVQGGTVVAELSAPRVETAHTHGTGCALASAIACGLAQGLDLVAAFRRAHGFVAAAIRAAPGLGGGHGPLGFLEAARAVGAV